MQKEHQDEDAGVRYGQSSRRAYCRELNKVSVGSIHPSTSVDTHGVHSFLPVMVIALPTSDHAGAVWFRCDMPRSLTRFHTYSLSESAGI